MPMPAAHAIIGTIRSVSIRAEAAGVTSRARTRMLPIVWMLMTTARVTSTERAISRSITGRPSDAA